MVRRAAHRVGHRGTMLILLGSVALLYGVGLVISPPAPKPIGLHLLLGLMGLHWWGITLITAGAIAVLCAPLRQGRDWPGWAALVAVWLPWSLSFLVSWWPDGDNPRGWISAAIFAAFAAIPAVAAQWDEPVRLVDRTR